MDKIWLLRGAFQCLAFCIFAFQMRQSLGKYFSFPIQKEVSVKKLDEVQSVNIYICQEGQYNFGKAQELGFADQSHFLAGMLDGNSVTEDGVNSADLLTQLLSYDYSSLALYSLIDSDLILLEGKKDIFIPPYGFCKKYTRTDLLEPNFYVSNKESTEIIFIDPNRDEQFRIAGSSHIDMEFSDSGVFEFSFYRNVLCFCIQLKMIFCNYNHSYEYLICAYIFCIFYMIIFFSNKDNAKWNIEY